MGGQRDECHSSILKTQEYANESEVFRILNEASKQYEEYLRIAAVVDVIHPDDDSFQPRYAWDNPIGLVIEERITSTSQNIRVNNSNIR